MKLRWMLAMALAGCSGPEIATHTGSPGPSVLAPCLQCRRSKLDKIDILFVIDNSTSMADKQGILAEAVPDLVGRLLSPGCLNSAGERAEFPEGASKCPADYPKRELDPVRDIHIGVISSSLGGHGADSCSQAPTTAYNPQMEDMSHLIDRGDPGDPSVRVETWGGQGFLAWDGRGMYSPPGDTDPETLIGKFTRIVTGTGQDGCGFEASLEAWYRFLIDPAPYARMSPCPDDQGGPGLRCPEGVDETVLTQRADFLRPDSMVVIVLLSDENDCSVIDGYQNYIALQGYDSTKPYHLPRATAACKTDPSSPACMSCAQGDHADDPECQSEAFTDQEDSLNLRCFRQKERFGIDFLYPLRRYVNGLTRRQFPARDTVFGVNPGFAPDKDFNPLFCTRYGVEPDGVTPNRAECMTVLRDPRLVFFAAIVGVPWQDLANDPNDLKKGYRPVEELRWTRTTFELFNAAHGDVTKHRSIPNGVTDTTTVWDQIVGRLIWDPKSAELLQIDPRSQAEPLDPLMIESVGPRTGTNPATGQELAPPSASSPEANKLNGHEWTIANGDDLQYACTFPLPKPRECAGLAESCDCSEAEGMDNSLCQAPDGSYGTLQYRAKAYPGRRQLAVLQALDPSQAIAASICPSNTADRTAADYGYRPAIQGIVNRLKAVLKGFCWGQRLEYRPDGSVACHILEGTKLPDGASQCPVCETLPWRKTPTTELLSGVSKSSDFIENGLQCACEIPQAPSGPELRACIESLDEVPAADGWCYVDPAAYPGEANTNLVLPCPPDAKRTLRFVGDGEPSPGGLLFLLCVAAGQEE